MAKFKLQEAVGKAKEVLEQGDSERAIAMCQYVLRYYPRCIEAFRLLGEAYIERGDSETAGKMFAYVLQADPHNVLAHVGRAIIYEEKGDIDAAIAEFERAFELEPGIRELRDELLRLYTLRFGIEGARVRVSRAGLAHLYARDGLLPQAITEFHDVLKNDPRLDVRISLAEVLWRDGQREEAARICNAVLQQVPNNLRANLILAQVWYSDSHQDDALALMHRAQALDPDSTVARSLYERASADLTMLPLEASGVEMPKWDLSDLTASSDLPEGLSEVVALNEKPRPSHILEGEVVEPVLAAVVVAPPPPPDAVAVETPTDQMRDAVSASLSEEVAAEIAPALDQPAAPASRDVFLQRLAQATATTPVVAAAALPEQSPIALQAAADAETAIQDGLPAGQMEELDWLERLAQSTRYEEGRAQSISDKLDTGKLAGEEAPKRGFLDDLMDDEVEPLPPQPVQPPKRGFLDELYEDEEEQANDPFTVAGDETLDREAQAAEAETRAEASDEYDAASSPAEQELEQMEAAAEVEAAVAEAQLNAEYSTEGQPPDEPSERAVSSGDPWQQFVSLVTAQRQAGEPRPTGEPVAEPWQQFVSLVTAQRQASGPRLTSEPAAEPWMRFVSLVTAQRQASEPRPTSEPAAEPWMRFVSLVTAQRRASAPRLTSEPAAEPWMRFVSLVTGGTQAEGAAAPVLLAAPAKTEAVATVRRVVVTGPLELNQPSVEPATEPWVQFIRTVTDLADDPLPGQPAAALTNATVAPSTEPAAVVAPSTLSRESAAEAAALVKPVKEEIMPSYAEDDEQGRSFEFDWEKEGLPDYLKEFVMGDNADLDPGSQQAASAAAPTGNDLPDWLSSSQPSSSQPAQQQPANQPAAASPQPPTRQPAGSQPAGDFGLDDGLPSWLTPGAATAQGQGNPAPFSFDEAAFTAPGSGQPSGQGAVQPFNLNDFGPSSPPQPAASSVQPFSLDDFDFGQPASPPASSQPTSGAQPSSLGDFDFGQPASPPVSSGQPASSVQPFSFDDFSFGQPADQAQPVANVQPFSLDDFSFGQPADQPRPAASSVGLGDLDDIAGLPSWLTPGPSATPAQSLPPVQVTPPAPSTAPQSGKGLQQTTATPDSSLGGDFDDMDGLPSWLSPQQVQPQPASQPATQTAAQPFSFDDTDFGSLSPVAQAGSNVDDLNDLEDFVDFLSPVATAPAPATRPIGASNLADSGVQPFSFDDANFGSPAGNTSVQPFSFDDMDFGTPPAALTPTTPGQPSSRGLDVGGLGNVQPFSFDDAAFTAPVGSPASQPAPSRLPASEFSNQQPFNLDDTGFTPPTGQPATSPLSNFDLGGLQPFSLDDSAFAMPSSPAAASSSLPLDDFDFGSLQPFNFDQPADNNPAPSRPAQPSPFAPPSQPAASNRPPADDFDFGQLQPFDFGQPADMNPVAPSRPAQPSPFTQPSQPAAGNRQPNDDFGLGSLQPFSFDNATFGSPAATPPTPATGRSDSFDFAPFSMDDALGLELPQGEQQPNASIFEQRPGSSPASTGRSNMRSDTPFVSDTPSDVRAMGWQRAGRQGAPPPPLIAAETSGSMFDRLRRKKDAAADSLLPVEAVSSVPAVGAPLTAEERVELANLNWPVEYNDGAVGDPSSLAQFTAPAVPAAASQPSVPTAPTQEASQLAAASQSVSAPPPLPASPLPNKRQTGELEPNSAAQIADRLALPELPTFAPFDPSSFASLKDDVLSFEESVPMAATQQASDSFDLSGLDLSPEERALLMGEDINLGHLDEIVAMQDQAGTGDYLQDVTSSPSFAAQPTTTRQPSVPVEATASPEFAANLYDSFADPNIVAPTIGKDVDAALQEREEPTAAVSEVEAARQRMDADPGAGRERWAEYLASPPRPPMSIRREEEPATSKDVEQSGLAVEADNDLTAEPAATAIVVEDAAPPTSSYVAPSPTPATPPSSYVSPASVLTPPSNYVPPAASLLPSAPPTPITTVMDEQLDQSDGLASERMPAPLVATPLVPPTASTPPPAPFVMPPMTTALPPAPASPPPAPFVMPALAGEPAIPPTPPTPPSSYVPPAPPSVPAPVSDSLTSISALRDYVSDHSDDLAAHYALATAYENSGDLDRALDQYRLIIKARAVPGEILANLVGNLQEMLTDDAMNNNPRVHRLLGDAYMKQGLFQHAISQYNWLLNK